MHEATGYACDISNIKKLIFFKNPKTHSFVKRRGMHVIF
jgi:hypothetical protein